MLSNLPGVALGVDGLPVFVRRSRTVLQCDELVANVAGDLPILLVCHLFDPGRPRRTFDTTGFSSSTTADRTECANEPRALRHRSFPHGQRSNEDLLTRRRKAPSKRRPRSFGEVRLTAIRQNHRINKGCRTTPVQPQTSAPSFNGRTADSGSAYRGSNPWGAAKFYPVFMRFSWTVLCPPMSVTFSVSALCPHPG